MINRFSRTQRVIGRDALHKIQQAHVIVFGVGGVGGYAIEALARSGIGKIDIVDHGFTYEHQPTTHRNRRNHRPIQSRCDEGTHLYN